MAAKYRQISLKDTFSDCQDMFIDDTPTFFQLLDPSSVEVLGNFRRFLPSSFSFISYCLDFSHIYSKFSTPFLGFFY